MADSTINPNINRGRKAGLELKGAKELEKALRGVGLELAGKIGKRAVRAGGKIITDEAKRLVPVDFGELQASIAQVDARDADIGSVGIYIGFLKPTSSRAHLTEFGTAHSAAQPFMRPALDSKAQAALNEMGRVAWKGIEAQARKLRRKAR